jgi:hypothetical protein
MYTLGFRFTLTFFLQPFDYIIDTFPVHVLRNFMPESSLIFHSKDELKLLQAFHNKRLVVWGTTSLNDVLN